MASECKRMCGYRQVGGLYVIGTGTGMSCCKLPIPIHVCPTCNSGLKQTRGWSWIDPEPFTAGECTRTPLEQAICAISSPGKIGERAGLLWVGRMYYETPELFMAEARQQGISRRLNHMPKGFRLGEHWVFLAHPAAIFNSHVVDDSKSQTGTRVVLAPSPGIFHIFRPNAIEKIVTEEQAQDEAAMKVLRDHGITPIIVGTNDVDHQGGPKQMEMELAD